MLGSNLAVALFKGGACDREVCGVFLPGVQSPQVENQLQGHLFSS